jgi:CPA2 family monovalent cation:H+ antiporter-2
MFGTGSLQAGTLLGLGFVLLTLAAGLRLAAVRGFEPFPVPLLVGLVVSAVGPLDVLRPQPDITRAGAEIAIVVLLFCVGLDHAAVDRRRVGAAGTTWAGSLLVVDAALNFVPGALFGLLAGFGPTGAVLLGGVTGASSWVMASGFLDREGRFGNRETPATLAVLIVEHTATAFYLPLAAALLAPGDPAARITAGLGAAAAVAFAAWLMFGPAPLHLTGLLSSFASAPPAGPPGVAVSSLLAGVALLVAGLAAAIGVATAAVAYLAGVAVAAAGADSDPAVARHARRTLDVLRDLSGAAAGLALGLLIPAGKLPGAMAGGILLAAITGATKVFTGWWAAGRIRTSDGPVGPAGRVRAGVALVPRGELALAVGILAVLSAPGRGPGPGLAALAAVEIVVTSTVPSLVRLRRTPGWYRWAGPTPAARRPDPSGAG